MRCFRLDRRPAFLVAALVFGLPCLATAWAKPHAKHAARDQVTALEDAWVKAQNTDDPAAMDKLLSPDYLGITASGEVETKAQTLDRMRTHALVVRSLQISDVRVKLISQHAASVTCLAQLDGTSDGQPLGGSFRYTHVYQKVSGGTWVITNFEATRAPALGNGGNGDSTRAQEPAPKN